MQTVSPKEQSVEPMVKVAVEEGLSQAKKAKEVGNSLATATATPNWQLNGSGGQQIWYL